MLRRQLRGFLSDVVDDPDLVDDLTLAASEALENVADHAYDRAEPEGLMRLAACSTSPSTRLAVVINVSDDGRWQEPGAPGHRGRGLRLIEQLTASLSVATGADGTCITICHPLGE